MGRTDAVPFTLEVVRECERLGARVTYEPGWDTRSNGTSANYEGGLVHHTASYSSEANPFPTQRILRDGRSDLPGPLCNMAGPWCPPDAPWLHVVSARPGNHAGASGGRSMGPLPTTGLFNPRVYGLEVDYSGMTRMAPGQYRAACIFGRAVTSVLGRPSAEWVRAHAETSVTGKWDPGWANGKTIDMAAFRRDVWATTADGNPEDEMTPDQARKLDQVWAMAQQNAHGVAGGWAAGANLVSELAFRNQVLTGLQAGGVLVDVDSLAAALAPLLVPAVTSAVGQAGGLTADQVEDITEKAMRQVLGSLAEPV